MTALDWPELRALIDAGAVGRVLAAMDGLDDRQRRALAAPVRAYARALPSAVEVGWRERARRAAALLVAGAGCLSGAGTMARWLTREDLWIFREDLTMTELVRLLQARDVPWLAELARRLADRVRFDRWDDQLWRLVAGLVSAAGMGEDELPAGDGFVLGWMRTLRPGRPLADSLAADPFLRVLAPRLFEVDGAGWILAWSAGRPEASWPRALAALAADGRLPRTMLVDRCLGRLLRGGRPGELRVPAAPRGAGPGPGRGGGQGPGLRPPAGRRPLRGGRGRPVGAAPARRPRAAGTRPAGGGEPGGAVPPGEGARPDPAVVAGRRGPSLAGPRRRAAGRGLGRLRPGIGRAPVPGAGAADAPRPPCRPGDAGRAAGGRGRPPRRPAPTGRRGPRRPGAGRSVAPVAGPVGATAAGAATTDRLAGRAGRGAGCVPPGRPRDGAGDPGTAAGRAGRLRPPRPGRAGPRPRAGAGPPPPALVDPDRRLDLLPPQPRRVRAAELGRPGRGDAPGQGAHAARAHGRRLGRRAAAPAPGLGRARAAAGHAVPPARDRRRPVEAAAAPAGHPDQPDRAPRPGRAPVQAPAGDGRRLAALEYDLQQALLRLPREPDPAVVADARRLATPAGRRLAAWLAGDRPPDPEVSRVIRAPRPAPRWALGVYHPVTDDRVRALASVAPGADPGRPRPASAPPGILGCILPRRPALADLLDELPEPERWRPRELGYWLTCWPGVAPSHRDPIAAHLLPRLAELPSGGRDDGRALPLLAEADGPVGPGMALALAYGLGARDPGDRAAAVDALLLLAGRRQLDGPALGTELGALAALGLLRLGRVVPGLRDAARSGAAPDVWAVLAAAIPAMLPPARERPPRGLPDLIALGAEVAGVVGGGRAIPELAAVTGPGASGRLATESRRLQRLLAATPTGH